jgi:tetratricopeptide (TPR) repeat protein
LIQKRPVGLLILAFALQLQSFTAYALQPFAVTEGELALMPPYCQAKYGKDRGNQTINEQFRGIYGDQNWLNQHHYCDALKFIIRANRSFGKKAELTYNLEQAQKGIEHLLASEQTPDWILRPEAHVHLGKIYLRMSRLGKGSEAKAVQNFEHAILIRADYEPAYSALSDFYADKGLKQKALDTIEEGLRHLPDSKRLLRRFKDLGGKTPPPPLVINQPTAPAEAVNLSTKEDKSELGESPSASPPNVPASPPPEQSQIPPPKIGSPSNPWCRFCTDSEKELPVEKK